MPSFKDAQDRTWEVSIDVNALKRLRDHDLDLSNVVNDGSIVEKFYQDPIALVDTLYLICKPQADALKVSDEEFGRCVGNGGVLDEATRAFLEAVAAFFRRKGAMILMAANKIQTLEATAMKRMEEQIEKLGDDEELLKTLMSGGSFGTAPESAGSTPAPIP